nr:hypothetical protein OG999_28805 [Streptomyces sp. NBC_00886]
MLALVALFGVWALLVVRRGFTSVGVDGITTPRRFPRPRTGLERIYDLHVEGRPNQRGAEARSLTHLYDNDGRRLILPNVDDWQLPNVRAEIDALRTAAARHRGTAWEPRPEVEARIRLRAGHRKAQERAITWALIVFFAALAYLL